MSQKKPDSPSRLAPILLYGESDSVECHCESANAGQPGLLRVLPTGMSHATLCLNDTPCQTKLVVFQAIPDYGFKAIVILTKLGYLFPFEMTRLHTGCPSPKAICAGVALLLEAFPARSGQTLT